MAEVVLENVTKVYPGNVVAVNDVSLSAADREFLVLVGPSGCGKTTTLRMIAGLEEVTRGAISIGGRVVNDVSPKDRDVAMVFQNYALYPHWSVYKNMAFGLQLRGVKRAEIDARVRQAAAVLGLTDLLGRKPRSLSGGQRQRVAVGRAIVRQPTVFLFDEPLSNLDARLRVEMRAELKRLHRRLETTVVYVTHDQVEAMTLGRRIAVLDRGVVQQVASPLDLYDRPANRFVAGFIGSPAMNLVDGRVRSGAGRMVFDAGEWTLPVPGHLVGAAAGLVDRPATLGVRPEDVGVRDRAPGGRAAPGGPAFPAAVGVIEPLGDVQLVHLVAGSREFVAKMDAHRPVETGMPVDVALSPGKVHLFDGASGVNVGVATGAKKGSDPFFPSRAAGQQMD